MLRRHRVLHRWIWTALAVLIPGFLAFALMQPRAGFRPPTRVAPPPVEKGQP